MQTRCFNAISHQFPIRIECFLRIRVCCIALPFDGNGSDEFECELIAGCGQQPPKERLPQISALQCVLFVVLDSGDDFRVRITVGKEQCHFAKLLILKQNFYSTCDIFE